MFLLWRQDGNAKWKKRVNVSIRPHTFNQRDNSDSEAKKLKRGEAELRKKFLLVSRDQKQESHQRS